MSFQQAMNGTATVHYGTPIAATLVNFIAGTAVLWLAWLIKDRRRRSRQPPAG